MKKKSTNKPVPSVVPAAFVKKSISIPGALYARVEKTMKARGLTNESAFIHTALAHYLDA